MLQKIKQWYIHRYHPEKEPVKEYEPVTSYTHEQLANAYRLGYTDGRRDGLSIAREQATNSLKEILWQQNKTTPKK